MKPLRWIAVLGTLAVLVQSAWASRGQLSAAWSFLFLVLAGAAVGAVFGWLMPSAGSCLRRHPDLLVPLGLVVLATAGIGWLERIPAMAALLTPSFPIKLGAVSLAVSAGFMLRGWITIAYATWMTLIVLHAVGRDRVELEANLGRVPAWFLRILGLELIGHGVCYVMLAIELPLLLAVGGLAISAMRSGRLSPVARLAPALMAEVMIAMGGLAVLWNLGTAALLPVAIDRSLGFWSAFRAGLRTSWWGLRRWGVLVVVQLLLLGLWGFLHVDYQRTSTSTEGGAFSESANMNFNFHFHLFWTGGYEDQCTWYQEFLSALKAPAVPLVSALVTLLFGVLAIGVKLTIVERLPRDRPPAGC